MHFSHRLARGKRQQVIRFLLAGLLILGGFRTAILTGANPQDEGLASVVEGAADDVLGQTLNADFSHPDFTHGYINDSTTAEALEGPTAAALDTQNHRLFVADSGHNRVLEFDLTTSNVFADRRADRVLGQADFKGKDQNRGGNPSGNTLATPQGLAFDSGGNRLFVADGSNNRVLVYDTTTITNGQSAVAVLGQTNFISNSFALTQSGLRDPRGLAYDASGKRLFVADGNNQRVLVFDVTAISNGQNAANVLGQVNFTSSASPTTASSVVQPHGLGYDASGNRLFVASYFHNRVMVFDVAAVSDGENAVAVLGQATFTASAAATTQSGLRTPKGLVYDLSGNRLLVADGGNNRVMVYDVATINNGENAVSVLGQANFTSGAAAVTQNGLTSPIGMAYDADGQRLLVTDPGSNRVMVFDLASIADGEAAVDLLGQLDASGNPLYNSDANDASRLTSRGLDTPAGAAVDAVNHRLFVADYGHHRVLAYNLDRDNRLVDRQPDAVLGQSVYTSQAQAVTQSSLIFPSDLAYDASGNRLFVSDSGNNRVLVYDTSAIIDGENAVAVLGQANFVSGDINRGGGVAADTLSSPAGLAYDSGGSRLFVSDNGNSRVLVYNATAIANGQSSMSVLGQADFISGDFNRGGSAAANTIGSPSTLAHDPVSNRLFLADSGNHRLLVYDVSTIGNGEDAVAVLGQDDLVSRTANRGGSAAANTLSLPFGVAYDPNASRLFVTDLNNNRALVYNVAGITNGQDAVAVLGQAGFTSNLSNRGGGVAAGSLFGPRGSTYDRTTNVLYLSDSNNNRVLVFNAVPTGTALAINGGAAYANSITATLAITATGAAQVQVSDSPGFAGSGYQTYATILPWNLPAGDGAKVVYARFRDNLLGVSGVVSDTIILDTTAPASFGLSNPVTGTITNTGGITFSWESSSDASSGLAGYQLFIDGALDRGNIAPSTTAVNATGILTDGLHIWKVTAQDNAGNSRESSSSSFTLDTLAPSISSVNVSSIATGTVTITWTTGEAASSQVEYGLTATYGSATIQTDTSSRVFTHTVVLESLTPATAYHYRARSLDAAGNAALSADGTFTTLLPTSNVYLPLLTRSSSGGW